MQAALSHILSISNKISMSCCWLAIESLGLGALCFMQLQELVQVLVQVPVQGQVKVQLRCRFNCSTGIRRCLCKEDIYITLLSFKGSHQKK